jgi:hypothetical protein
MTLHCNECGEELDSLIPFKCKYCGLHYCKHHRLPENHNCVNLPSRRPLISQPDKPLAEPKKYRKTGTYPEIEENKIYETNSEPESNIIKKEKPKKTKKVKRHRRSSYKIRLSNLTKIFLASLILFVILHLTLLYISTSELWIIYIVVLCITEVTGLFLLLFKLDRISTHSTLRLWGLRILAGLILFVGLWLLLMIWISSLFITMFYPFMDIDPLVNFLSIMPFLIPGLGLMGIGAYLEFRFRRESGLIVYRG